MGLLGSLRNDWRAAQRKPSVIAAKKETGAYISEAKGLLTQSGGYIKQSGGYIKQTAHNIIENEKEATRKKKEREKEREKELKEKYQAAYQQAYSSNLEKEAKRAAREDVKDKFKKQKLPFSVSGSTRHSFFTPSLPHFKKQPNDINRLLGI